MTQIQRKKKKMTSQFWKKKTLQKRFFTSVLTIAGEMEKTKGKNPDKYTHSNRNNDAKILYIFTGNVKTYIELHT